MADRNLEIALRIRADLQQARRQLQQMEKGLEDVGDQGQRAGNETSRGMERIRTGARAVASSLAAIGVAGGIFTAIARGAANSAVELERMALLSNTNVEAFQRLAYAAGQYNIPQEKLADILKDTNDRVGDFLTTGGGELADFMEQIAPKIGLTADQLARMSGPEALQAVYNGLEQANLSAAEMTFYMESLADEATALIPLLRNNGAAIRELGDEADRTGSVLSRLEIERLSALRAEFQQLEQQLTTETARAVSQFDQMMTASLQNISFAVSNTARGFNAFLDSFRDAENKRSIEGINSELDALFDNRRRLEQRIDMFGEDSAQARDAQAAMVELKAEYDALIERKMALVAVDDETGGSGFQVPPPLFAPSIPGDDNDNDTGGGGGISDRQSALNSLTGLESGLREQIATFGEGKAAALEYRLTVGDLADDVARLGAEGDALAASIIQQAQEIETLTETEERRAQAEQERQRAQQQAEEDLQRVLDQANPSREMERQLELIEELKTQFPEYAAALEVAAEQVRDSLQGVNEELISARQVNAQFAYSATSALGGFAEDIADGNNAIESLGDAFAQFAADFLRQIAQMIIQQMIFNALQNSAGGGVGGFVSGLFGGGGGGGASAAAGGIYANLPTFHGGGVVGAGGSQTRLAPDEMLTLQRRGEEVLTTADPRHRNNQGGQGRSGETAIYNMIDGDSLAQAVMASPQGRRGIINVIKADKGQIKTILGN